MKRTLNEMEAFRAQELLHDRATVGLDDAELAELAALGVEEDISFDLAAAAVDLATVQIEELPAGVADKILATVGIAPDRASITGVPTTLAGVAPPRPLASPPQPTEAPIIPITSAPRRSRAPIILASAAAAAGLALAIGAVLWAREQKPEVVVKEIVKVPVQPSPTEARSLLLEEASDTATLSWTANAKDPAGAAASGDVVWSASKQKGFMRFKGLAPNDPKKTQYQLWIFDKNRDEKFPVDGGVFDVGSNGEVIVAISAKLPVADPTLFAVTVEVPGGVVVSKRERIVVTAAPKAG